MAEVLAGAARRCVPCDTRDWKSAFGRRRGRDATGHGVLSRAALFA